MPRGSFRRTRTLPFLGRGELAPHQILGPTTPFVERNAALEGAGNSQFDLGGGGDYKRKFGASERSFPFMRKSMVPGMLAMRDLAASLYKRRATRAPSPARDGGVAQRGPTPFPRATAGGLRPRGEVAESPAERDRTET